VIVVELSAIRVQQCQFVINSNFPTEAWCFAIRLDFEMYFSQYFVTIAVNAITMATTTCL